MEKLRYNKDLAVFQNKIDDEIQIIETKNTDIQILELDIGKTQEMEMQAKTQNEKKVSNEISNEFDEFKDKWEWSNMQKRFQNILEDRIKCSDTKSDLLNYLNRF